MTSCLRSFVVASVLGFSIIGRHTSGSGGGPDREASQHLLVSAIMSAMPGPGYFNIRNGPGRST